ncbi:MAG: DUF58 domain-containing protein [Candidatus Dormibacteria bacterium]
MTPRGAGALLGATLLVALAAAIPPLLVPSLVLVGAVLVTIAIDGRAAPRVRVRRECDQLFSIGAPNVVRLHVEAPPRTRVLVRDGAPRSLAAEAPILQARGAAELAYTLTPFNRGNLAFEAASVRTRGPWGLGTRDSRSGEDLTVRVDADISAVRVYEALARRGQLEELGMRSLRRRGEGTEFERVREAVPDDPLRSINWRATARTGRLMSTDLMPERDQPVIACLDHGRLMGVGAGTLTKYDHAVNAALLLLHVALRTGDRGGVLTFADSVTGAVAPRGGTSQLRRILDAVGRVAPGEIESDHAVLVAGVERIQRRRALVIVFTDVVDIDQVASLAVQCRALKRRHLPVVVTVRDPAVEDAARARPDDITAAYRRAVAAGLAADRLAAVAHLRAAGVDVIDADARVLSPRLVNRYLELKRRAAV